MDNIPYVWGDNTVSNYHNDVCVVKYYVYVPEKNQSNRKIELSGIGVARRNPADTPDAVVAGTLAASRALKNLAKNLESYARSRVDHNDAIREKARETQQAALERIWERKRLGSASS